ncbi:MAG: DUF302 domain-containing protein [Candidatus Dormiibacterota bacterium]
MLTRTSPGSVADTVTRLSALLAARGIKEFAVIDHSGEAHAAGLELRDTKVVIFGSPRAGTPVMAAAPLAALDLPLRILIWDDGGETRLSYTSPAALAERYGLSEELAARLAAVETIAIALTQGEPGAGATTSPR